MTTGDGASTVSHPRLFGVGMNGDVTIDEEKGVGLAVCRVHLETDQANASQHIQ